MKPKKAAPNIMPSMAMLTTPARSQNTPDSAPSVNGVATARVVAMNEAMILAGSVSFAPMRVITLTNRMMISPMNTNRRAAKTFEKNEGRSDVETVVSAAID